MRVGTPDIGGVMDADTNRGRLLATVEDRRREIDRYLARTRPVSSRLTTISVISSCVAAALAAGPAVGGEDMAVTVQNGLALGRSQAVWRLLCLAAVIASVTAAIAANLSRSTDLTARVAAAEAANTLLDGLSARLRFSRLAMSDAAQQYQEIVARVPWVSESDEAEGDGPATSRRRPTRYLIGTVVFAGAFLLLAGFGLIAGLVRGGPVPLPQQPEAAPGATVPAPSAPPSVTPVAQQVFSGSTVDGTALAVVVDGDRAAAYLCDGATVEAWLEGAVDGDSITLRGRDGATVISATGATGSTLGGSGSAGGRAVEFSIAAAGPPAGVYEARVQVGDVEVRLGWAVSADGTPVGVQNRGGRRAAAPPLTLPAANFELDGVLHTAELRDGGDDVVPGS